MYTALMLGAGHSPVERRYGADLPKIDTWFTLDCNADADPDYKFNLGDLEVGADLPGCPYDEIHAYETLEHFGTQGDFKGLFNTFNALHRALKPKGLLIGSTPAQEGRWVWGDPGHCRYIGPETLHFLSEENYGELGKTAMTDYRRFIDPHWWNTGFDVLGQQFYFIMEKV
jgi:hypothetical protein